MHKGREYPYAPQFWLPTGFFWPYFAPWKWRITGADFIPFGVLIVAGTPDPFISEAVENPGGDIAIWSWPMPWAVYWDALKLTIYCETHLDAKYMVFHLQVLLAGVEVTGGYATFVAYLFEDNFPGTEFFQSPYDTSLLKGGMNFQVANWHEAGSPWPS